MLVKGFLVVPAVLCCGLWFLVRSRGREGGARARWIGPLLAVVGGLLALAFAYEWAYRQAAGEPFLLGYAARNLSIGGSTGHPWSVATMLYNFVFYLGRLLWFAFPWSLVLIVAGVRAWRRARPRPEAEGTDPEVQGLLFVLGAVAIYLSLLSLSARRAERYIYVLYPLVGGAGAVMALRRWPWLSRVSRKLERLEPYTPALVWLFLVGLHLAGAYLPLPRIQLWKP